jgi:hypothetical protein
VQPPGRAGSWADTYRVRGRPVTLTHVGGPAGGHTATVPLGHVPQARHWATTAERARRAVTLARYVQHGPVAMWEIAYHYSGIQQMPGPVPGRPDEPEWS